jgi:hypothetical protein
MAKRITPVALAALKEALRCIYWYKGDLESFIRFSITSAADARQVIANGV